MEIDVRQRNQRSLKRRERALRMQAERESGQQGVPPLNGSSLSTVAGAATSGDSCDDDEVLLLKRSPAQQQQQHQTPASQCPSGGLARKSKKATEKAPPAATTASNTLATAMKEEAPVDDWLKMEPRLPTPEENGVESAMDVAPAADEESEEAEEMDSPLLEEDVIDGFAIQAFKTYEDLEVSCEWARGFEERETLFSVAPPLRHGY